MSSLDFTDVTGQWVEPRATCSAGQSTTTSFEVGLGGFALEATEVEEVGTSAICSASGQASYDAWYELVPSTAVTLKLTVDPGDLIASSVVVHGSTITLQVIDRTRKTRATTQLNVTSPLDTSSAEWLAQVPSSCSSGNCRPGRLTRFGSVTFTHAFATASAVEANLVGQPVSGAIMSPYWTPQAIVLDGGTGKSVVPVGLAPDGKSFTLVQL
jgi:hypothetical protein